MVDGSARTSTLRVRTWVHEGLGQTGEGLPRPVPALRHATTRSGTGDESVLRRRTSNSRAANRSRRPASRRSLSVQRLGRELAITVSHVRCAKESSGSLMSSAIGHVCAASTQLATRRARGDAVSGTVAAGDRARPSRTKPGFQKIAISEIEMTADHGR